MPSVCSRVNEGIGVSRATTEPSGVSNRLAVVREVRWGFHRLATELGRLLASVTDYPRLFDRQN